MKMRNKIMLLCLLATLFALILQTVLFQSASSKLIIKQTKKENYRLIQNMQDEIKTYIKEVEGNMVQIYSDKEFLEQLGNSKNHANLKKEYYRQAYQVATEKFDVSDKVVAAYIYTDKHELISTYRRAVTPKHNYPKDIYQNETEYNSARVKEYVESGENDMLISSYYNKHREKNLLRFALKIYDMQDVQRMIGYIVCDIDSSVIETIMDKYQTQQGMCIWLQPYGDRVILSNGKIKENNKLYFEEKMKNIEAEKEHIQREEEGENHVLFCVSQPKYNLNAYSIVPREMLEENQKILTKNLIWIAVIMSITIMIVVSGMSLSLTKPLDRLMHTIACIKAGDTKKRVKYLENDEIGNLGKQFNEMLDEIEDLVGEKYQTKLLLKNAEYKALQAQINPHFLYNTLDTMSSIASIQNCSMVSNLCKSLSNLFRYSLDMKQPYTTIAHEIEYLKNYIYVMNVRMGGKVEYQFTIDEESLSEQIPRISIQPLVENALKHGLKNKEGAQKIEMVIKVDHEKLQIIVKDNGVGMDAAAVNRQLEENGTALADSGTSIGLFNINARMKMLYGEKFGLHIESILGKGTSVILTVPRRKEETV